eukprot:10195602-Heterocapsa_arctica.AAC.1
MTTNRDKGHHSYIVKNWQDKQLTVIKLTPKGGIETKWSNSLKRNFVTSKDDRATGKNQGWEDNEWSGEWQAPEDEEPDHKKGAPA